MYERIETTVRDLDPDNPEQLTAVCQQIRDRGLREITEVVRIAHEGNQKEAENARAVISEIGDLALAPMLNRLSLDKPEDLVWDIQAAVTFHLENRTRIVKWLDDMLLDKTILPPPFLTLTVEEKPPEMRLCDHAYLLMRQLFALEDEETELINTDMYMGLTDEERDQEIDRARQTHKWISLSDYD